jgi:hypothetical protein
MACVSGHFLSRASPYNGLQLRGSIAGCFSPTHPLSPLIDQGTRESRSIPNRKKNNTHDQHIQLSSPVKQTASSSDQPARPSTSNETRPAGLGSNSTTRLDSTRLDEANYSFQVAAPRRHDIAPRPLPLRLSISQHAWAHTHTHNTTQHNTITTNNSRWDQSRVRQLQHQKVRNITAPQQNTQQRTRVRKLQDHSTRIWAPALSLSLSSDAFPSGQPQFISLTSIGCFLSS